MKAQKVKLVRQMREENEKFRSWRQQKEREVARLKDRDRKRLGEIQKMEVLHAKQQSVLRRKMEEANAVSKRLKEALCLRSTKPTKSSNSSTPSDNEQRIKGRNCILLCTLESLLIIFFTLIVGWLVGELDLVVKTKEAELALESLIEARRTLAARQSKLEAKLKDPNTQPTVVLSLKNEIANVTADLDMRSGQIVELKQKIAAADLDTISKTRLDYLQTMVEAKVRYI